VQARILDEVAAAGGGDGGDVADVLDHGGERDRHDRDDGAEQESVVDLAGEQAEDGLALVDGNADPGGLAHGLGEIVADGRVKRDGDEIGADDAEQDRDDLDHALAPDIGGDDDHDGHEGDAPVDGAVVDGALREREADGDDDGARDDRREVAHDLLAAEELEEGREEDVHEAGAGDAEAGVGQQLGLLVGGDGEIAGEEREGRAEERGNLALGQQVEQQRAETRKQQGRADVKTRQGRDKDGRAEHGEHVLEAEHQHPGLAQYAGVIEALLRDLHFFCHKSSSLLLRVSGRSGIKKEL